MKTKDVIVLPYDPQWAIEFERLSTFLWSICGSSIVVIHHVGSTSVEGLVAKPILDIDIEIRSLNFFNTVKEKLSFAGYRHEGDLDIPGREAFKVDSSPFMAHHLYVCTSDALELKRHLAFRDHLRTHPKDKDAYGEIKLNAAQHHPTDIDGYMDDKNEIITDIYNQLKEEGKIKKATGH
jgi:GrpB-like predicted nucleotidyltransferase (UPF0157 family)